MPPQRTVVPLLLLSVEGAKIADEDARQYDREIEDYNKAIQLDPNLAGAYLQRGLAYEMKGNTVSAISDFQKACALGSEIGCENLQRVLRQK